ncbi:hypothetical protein BST65_03545 [Bradyrhizobium canariense]|nr:hypothetical protein BST65_03545 [Bradyrhizobium canariense]OSI36935.1 hypothetical protein BST66_04905 [Bradyrhizobium canariense]OSI50358.1 hypothetical protein BSZ20_05915 [Bradyrhizobium canariense]OSI55779.1 hypothetical protein BST67_04520 [Bradyrhizobium canariense]OSI59058.1 hypothetical protein BSZ15_06645 [Bradyrhizobium canariense]
MSVVLLSGNGPYGLIVKCGQLAFEIAQALHGVLRLVLCAARETRDPYVRRDAVLSLALHRTFEYAQADDDAVLGRQLLVNYASIVVVLPPTILEPGLLASEHLFALRPSIRDFECSTVACKDLARQCDSDTVLMNSVKGTRLVATKLPRRRYPVHAARKQSLPVSLAPALLACRSLKINTLQGLAASQSPAVGFT